MLKISRIEKLKPLDLAVMESTMADMTDQVVVQDFFANCLNSMVV